MQFFSKLQIKIQNYCIPLTCRKAGIVSKARIRDNIKGLCFPVKTWRDLFMTSTENSKGPPTYELDVCEFLHDNSSRQSKRFVRRVFSNTSFWITDTGSLLIIFVKYVFHRLTPWGLCDNFARSSYLLNKELVFIQTYFKNLFP